MPISMFDPCRSRAVTAVLPRPAALLTLVLCVFAGAVGAAPASAQVAEAPRRARPAARLPRPVMGNYAAELRTPDGHIDTPAMIRALKALGANTYFYLIWHSKNDWGDLPAFAEAAARENIDVWVYLIPWSETPAVKKSWGYSEPFRLDYVRWAEEVARLSLKHPNVIGYAIDDFYTNTQPDRFSQAYTRRMVQAGRAINPRIKFYALCYFTQPWREFVDRYGAIVDGVVGAYPKSRLQVGNALAYLNDEALGATAMVEFPRRTPSLAGDKGTVWADVRITDPADATLSFYWDDDNHKLMPGYHTPFVKVDGRTVWQADVSGESDHVVEIDLGKAARGRRDVRIELGVTESRGVGHFPVVVKFDDIRLTGCDVPSEMTSERLWTRRATGAFEVDLLPSSRGRRRFQIPLIVMPAGEAEQHIKRYPEPGTPRTIAAKTRIGLDLMLDGRVQGVVTYCLPNDPENPIFRSVADEYRRVWREWGARRGAGG